MCVAVPMKVMEINSEDSTARVSLSGNILHVNISLISPKVGDFVLVHAGCAMEIIKKEEAEEIAELFDALEQLAGEERGE